jgi:hypothetical protein
VPFAQLLTGEGYQVVHLSRHGPSEEGKDILAIDPTGTPCAFQLKSIPDGGKFTQNLWEKELGQITRLVEIPIQHPSIDPGLPRRVCLVINGELDEEVRTEIMHRNPDWVHRGHPQLDTIVKGQLLSRFKGLHTDLWPAELAHEKILLEFFLTDGTACLDKGKLADFLITLLPLHDDKLNKAKCSRALASAALLTAYALSPCTEKSNYVALIEGWVVYLACLTALVEKHELEDKYWEDSLEISMFAIEQAFLGLVDELKSRTHLVEGEPLVDAPFYRGRVTWLIGLVSAFALWNRLREPRWEIEDWPKTFWNLHSDELLLWGEAAMPQFLATFWFFRQITATAEPDRLLASLIANVLAANDVEDSVGLPDPYHKLEEVIARQQGILKDPYPENFKGRSYSLESLVHLYAKRGWRQGLKHLWPRITRLHYAEFRPPQSWQWCLWHSEDGEMLTIQPKMTQSWAELRDQAKSVNTSGIPKLFLRYPELLLMFIIVYPHRLTKDAVKLLDDRLREAKRKRTTDRESLPSC